MEVVAKRDEAQMMEGDRSLLSMAISGFNDALDCSSVSCTPSIILSLQPLSLRPISLFLLLSCLFFE